MSLYEIDPLICDKCGGSMKIVAFLQDSEEIKQISAALNLPNFHPDFAKATSGQATAGPPQLSRRRPPPPFPKPPQDQFNFNAA